MSTAAMLHAVEVRAVRRDPNQLRVALHQLVEQEPRDPAPAAALPRRKQRARLRPALADPRAQGSFLGAREPEFGRSARSRPSPGLSAPLAHEPEFGRSARSRPSPGLSAPLAQPLAGGLARPRRELGVDHRALDRAMPQV